jgi:hypothetical protein
LFRPAELDTVFISRLFVQPSYRREVPMGGIPSLQEITGRVLAKFKDHQKEREVHFQVSWNRVCVCFPFT